MLRGGPKSREEAIYILDKLNLIAVHLFCASNINNHFPPNGIVDYRASRAKSGGIEVWKKIRHELWLHLIGSQGKSSSSSRLFRSA